MPDLDTIAAAALAALEEAEDLEALEQVRVRFTGRKSDLAALQRSMGELAPDERKDLGKRLNDFKQRFEARFEERRAALADAALAARLESERLDLTAPPRRVRPGRPHLITQVMDQIVEVFLSLGYQMAEGPEIEAGRYNFDLLNIPPEHPARQEMDTVYVSTADDVVLRTHTSPVQARVMTRRSPPIAVVVPGRVFRADTVDATHSPVFHQVEGLLVDEEVTLADLRGTLLAFARGVFGGDRDVRLRPSMFPFTEPSAEVDVSCGFCEGGRSPGDASTCGVCSGTTWIEVLGAGMVDPAVLEACGLDPARHSGFAFGIGVERVAMLRHDVSDVRDLYEGDLRFLTRF